MTEFVEFQKRVEWGKFITYTPIWVTLPMAKEYGKNIRRRGYVGSDSEEGYSS